MFSLETLDYDTRQKLFADKEAAREFIEEVRWAGNPVCPHCDHEAAYKLEPKPDSDSPVRPGVYKCSECRKQFTVTVGTIFEGTRLGLNKWLYALYLMCSSKKGISANQLSRDLGVQYKTAWFLCHRIRKAMEKEPLRSKLDGVVEADETYVGGKLRKGTKGPRPKGPLSGGQKTVVYSLVARDGEARSQVVPDNKAETLQGIMKNEVEGSAHIMTDGAHAYLGVDTHFRSHESVDHGRNEFVRGIVHTNFAESYFSLLKRGIIGAFHHVSKKHLQRYLEEFDFRWNLRNLSDWERVVAAIRQAGGKRLYYRALRNEPQQLFA